MRISLVIPTRERAELLEKSLATALAVPDPNLEIVVSDNASTDATAEVLARISDPRLKVVRTERRVSMRRNFETAMTATTGDHVIFIGDDDAVSVPGMAMLRRVLEDRDPEAVSWEMVHYTWPSSRPNQHCGFLRVKPQNVFGGLSFRSAASTLTTLAAGQLRNYKDTANLYHGCVSRRVIERVRTANNGVYFAGAIPDVYAGVANLVHMQGDLVWLGHPVTLGGASDRSNGASQMAAVKRPVSGTVEMNTFLSEASDDAGAARINVNIPSVDALTLDMLDMVNRQHAGNSLDINYPAWFDKILKRLVCMPRAEYQRGHDLLAAYSVEIGQGPAFDAAVGAHRFCGPETAPEGRRPTASKIRPFRLTLAHPQGLGDAYKAAQAFDTIFGAHHPDHPRFRWLKWFSAVRRAGRLASGWK